MNFVNQRKLFQGNEVQWKVVTERGLTSTELRLSVGWIRALTAAALGLKATRSVLH